MTAVTALFMLPTAVIFPALLRRANTPPSSVTLERAARLRRRVNRMHQGLKDDNFNDEEDGSFDLQRQDFTEALNAGE